MSYHSPEMRFTADSIELLYRVKQSAYRRASDRALERARRDGRDLVTEADVLAGLRAALDEAASAELGSGDAVEHASPVPETVVS